MQAHDQSGKKKIQLMNSIMQHPKLSRTFSDAMRAPIGSTKRKHAKSIVGVLSKVYENNHDGAGGPGDATATSTSPFAGMTLSPTGQLTSGTTTSKSTIVIPSAPEPWQPGLLSPGGPVSNFIDNKFMPTLGAASAGAYGLAEMGVKDFAKANVNALVGAKNLLFGYNPNDPGGYDYTGFSDTTGGKAASKIWKGYFPDNNGMQNTAAPIMQNAANVSTSPNLPPGKTTTWDSMVQSGQYGPVSNTPIGQTNTGPQQPGDTSGGSSGYQSGGSSGYQSGGASYSGGSDIGLGGKTGAGSYKSGSLEDAAMDAVGNNIGGMTFAMKVMQDKNLLKQLYPGVPEDQLPIGASLTNQINDLSTMLKGNYHLDSLQSQLTQKINAGVSLPNDIAAYIRGKDQIIGHIDSMLQDVQNKMPQVAGQTLQAQNTMKNYQNYLLIMKGRANQRYVDFANDSINQFNQQTTAIQNAYNTAKDLYTSEFATKSAAKQEDYNRTYSVLKDLYDNISAAPDKQIQRQMLEAQLTAVRQSIILSAVQAAGGSGSGGGYGTSGVTFTHEDYQKAYDSAMRSFGDSKGVLDTGLSIKDLVTQAIKSGGPATATMNAWANLLSRKLATAKSIGEVEEYQRQLNDLFSDPYVAQVMAENPDSAFSDLQNSTSSLLSSAQSSVISSNPEPYRNAIGNLFSSGFLGMGGGKLKTLEQWIKDNPTIPANILTKMYQNIKAWAATGPNAENDLKTMIKQYSSADITPSLLSKFISDWSGSAPPVDTTP